MLCFTTNLTRIKTLPAIARKQIEAKTGKPVISKLSFKKTQEQKKLERKLKSEDKKLPKIVKKLKNKNCGRIKWKKIIKALNIGVDALIK